jgi:NAD(P)-dependent dehydrogenase (short-subunit alcohol dehydrogenase family)
MEIRFDNKIVLVTGASRGVGAATANLFADAGAKVAVHYHKNKLAADGVVNSLFGDGHRIFQADLGGPEETTHLFDAVISHYGRIDILVNNAGIYEEEPEWLSLDFSEWQRHWSKTIRTNLTGPANLAFLAAQEMVKGGGGKIINVTSRGAFRGEPDALPYGAAKAGLNSLGQSMAKKLAPQKVYVFTLAPGFIETDMTTGILNSERGPEITAQSPMNRVASPEEIGHAILMLAADGLEYMTGCIVDMNGASYLRQ